MSLFMLSPVIRRFFLLVFLNVNELLSASSILLMLLIHQHHHSIRILIILPFYIYFELLLLLCRPFIFSLHFVLPTALFLLLFPHFLKVSLFLFASLHRLPYSFCLSGSFISLHRLPYSFCSFISLPPRLFLHLFLLFLFIFFLLFQFLIFVLLRACRCYASIVSVPHFFIIVLFFFLLFPQQFIPLVHIHFLLFILISLHI